MAWLNCVESFMSLQYEIWIKFFKIKNYNEVIYFFFLISGPKQIIDTACLQYTFYGASSS